MLLFFALAPPGVPRGLSGADHQHYNCSAGDYRVYEQPPPRSGLHVVARLLGLWDPDGLDTFGFRGAAEGPAGLPRSSAWMKYCDPSGADAAPANPCVTVAPTSGLERAQGRNEVWSIGFAASASSPAGRGRPTSSSTWRRCAGSVRANCGRLGWPVLVRWRGPGPRGLMAAEVRPEGGPFPALVALATIPTATSRLRTPCLVTAGSWPR